jgi:hypothetical protein
MAAQLSFLLFALIFGAAAWFIVTEWRKDPPEL